MVEMRHICLSDVIIFKNGKKKPDDVGDIPIYGGNGILGYTNQSNYNNCIVIGRVGSYCGSVYYEPGECWVSDNAIAAIPISDMDVYYSYYLLKNLNLNNRHIGTGQPLLTQEILNKIECRIPALNIQERIAAIFKVIDQKIAANSKINRNFFPMVA
jgi:type I restriction enzyme S subunit